MSVRFFAQSLAALALVAVLSCTGLPARAEQPSENAAKRIPAETAIRQALAKPVKLTFVETPLVDAARSLEKTLGVPVRLDLAPLDDVGIAGNEPVTFQVAGISARSALELLLRPLDLAWVIAHEMLLITTPEEADTRLITEVYDVADLVCSCQQAEDCDHQMSCCDFHSLIDVIQACIQLDSWDCVGGPGSMNALEAARIKVIICSQTQRVHGEVALLLADLRKARREKPAGAGADEKPRKAEQASPTKDQGPPSREEAIRRALARPIRLDFKETPLSDVVTSLKRKTGVEVLIDHKALDDVGIGADTPLTVQVADVKLRSALDFILRPLDLTWTVAHEVLLITTPEDAEGMVRTKVYDICDLPSYRNEQGEGLPAFEFLADAITGCIEPVSWSSVGGPGSIEPFDAPGIKVLVVSQTWKTHERIDTLLEKLRQLRGKPLTEEEIARLPLPPKPWLLETPMPKPQDLQEQIFDPPLGFGDPISVFDEQPSEPGPAKQDPAPDPPGQPRGKEQYR